jgi:glycosyltransferase involved in cell wall biosynthesis
VNGGNLYGGVESILVTLAKLRALCPELEPSFALCFEGQLSRELEGTGVPVYLLGNVRISRPWTVWRARRRLREVLNRERFDVVICHMPWSMAIFGPEANSSVGRLAFWAHAFHGRNGWLERLAQRATPDIAIATSRFAESGLANIFPGVVSGVVHPPVEDRLAAGVQQSRSAIRRELGAAEDTAVVIQVSRLEAWKGHLPHLQALAQLRELEGWMCWFVGGAQRPEEEQYFSQLRNAAEKLGIAERVKFLGQRSDVPNLLAAADIFCQPNLEPEPFGIVFVEALLAGKPVVTTRMGGALEILDESCGVLAEPGDVKSLATALRRLIESPELRARLRSSCAARGSELSDPASQMNRLLELLGADQGASPGGAAIE